MKKFFSIFFTVLGVIFFFILIALAYLFIADPFNIKPLIFGDSNMVFSENQTVKSTEVIDENSTEEKNTETPTLSPAQTEALNKAGIDPNTVRRSFTAEEITCFETTLGQERVLEIKQGTTPTVAEFFSVKNCIE